MRQYLRLSWMELHGRVIDICNSIREFGIHYDGVYGIPRGGLIPAVMASHILNVPLINHLTFDVLHKAILVWDDIVDSGDTISRYHSNFDTAAVCYKPDKASHRPTYYSMSVNDEWIVFPYECDHDTISKVLPIDPLDPGHNNQ